MACIVTVAGLQGQAGKTTIAANLAASFVLRGQSCLLIDLAPGADASRALGVNISDGSLAAAALLADSARLKTVRLPTASGIDLVAGHSDVLQLGLTAEAARNVLGEQLRDGGCAYDFVILDCAPRLGPIETAALAVADHAIMACSPGEAMGQPPARLPRLQLAYVNAPIGVVTNKVVPESIAAHGNNHVDWAVKARHLGALRYVPNLQEAYWFGIPPVMRQPRDDFAQDVEAVARALVGG
jgi:cellulose biosynthesis protein BcsQ